jgi:hypothetical protein
MVNWYSMNITQTALYSFTTFTFTNAGVTGNYGPTLGQIQSSICIHIMDTKYKLSQYDTHKVFNSGQFLQLVAMLSL